MGYLLRMYRNGYPVPAKLLPSLVTVILQQRLSSPKALSICTKARRPGWNWHLAFYRRHPELKARRVKAIDLKRHDCHVFHKVTESFGVIGRELRMSDVLQENVYNMDETGILLSALHSLKC